MPKVTLTCHPEAEPKDLANEKEILRFAQNDSFAVILSTSVKSVAKKGRRNR